MEDHPVLLFDGYCNLCVSSVQFVLRNERKKVLYFASLQSNYGNKIKIDQKIPENIDSLILFESNKVYYYSDAIIKLCGYLGGLWTLVKFGYIFPRFIRDNIYKFVARNRYRFFGKRQICWIPNADYSNRFIE